MKAALITTAIVFGVFLLTIFWGVIYTSGHPKTPTIPEDNYDDRLH